MKKKSKFNLELKSISALNSKQKEVLVSNKHQVLSGSAGTGKTYLASWKAFKGLQDGDYERVMYFRSAVPTRDIGFLPGNEQEKMQVYTKPYVDICTDLFQCGTAYHTLQNQGKIMFEPTSFVRGKTIRNAFVIVDECQNMTFHELDSIITRLDGDSTVIFCGDTDQADLNKNGFFDFCKILDRMDEFDAVSFTVEDIVRGPLVKSYLKTKASYYNKK